MERPSDVSKTLQEIIEKESAEEIKGLVAALLPLRPLTTSKFDLSRLYNEAQVKLWLKDKIPCYMQLGAAIRTADCFIHSIAECLNQRSGKEEYSLKTLRMFCDEYAKHPKNTWIETENIKDREYHDSYLVRVQFTTEELLANERDGLKLGLATCGRPKVEGRMICEGFDAKIHVIEVQEDGTIHRYLVDRNGESEDYNLEIDYQSFNILHIVNYHNHIVPLLRNNAYIPQAQRATWQIDDGISHDIKNDSPVKSPTQLSEDSEPAVAVKESEQFHHSANFSSANQTEISQLPVALINASNEIKIGKIRKIITVYAYYLLYIHLPLHSSEKKQYTLISLSTTPSAPMPLLSAPNIELEEIDDIIQFHGREAPPKGLANLVSQFSLIAPNKKPETRTPILAAPTITIDEGLEIIDMYTDIYVQYTSKPPGKNH